MTLSGSLTQIQVAYAPATGVSGIKFYRGAASKPYGNMVNEITTWQITAGEPIVGLYGYQSARGIEAISLVTLDMACQGSNEEKGTDRPFPQPERDDTEDDDVDEPVTTDQ